MRIVLQGIGVRFGDRHALRDVSACFESGVAVAISGPSGAGKSSLLAVLGGLLRPHAGDVLYPDGHPRRLEWIAQENRLLSRRSALDNVKLSCLGQSMGDEPAAIAARAAMGLVDIIHLQHQPAFKLSGGERQRVAVARAIASRPDLILADEPTASLDATSRDLVTDALVAAASAGAAIVIATHDPAVASRCDRMLVLDDGQLQATGGNR
jgi:ABC-type lipoprotein export system ATPase subunit